MLITIQIITKDNEKTIHQTLESIKFLSGAVVVVADLGSKDGTVKICELAGAKLYQVPARNYDYSHLRNQIVASSDTDWQFWIKPWEVIAEGQEGMIKALASDLPIYQLLVMQPDLITKEVRLWRKTSGTRFIHPVFENIEGSGKVLNTMLIAKEPFNDFGETLAIITKWRDQFPTLAEPDYYLACTYLMHHRYMDFLRMADHYIFRKKVIDDTVLMIKYYCAMVYCQVTRNPYLALTNIMECIAAYPTMAEFWCLLGDIYLRLQDFERAREFYENAKILGSQRKPGDDNLPIILSKYEDYPNQMLSALNKTNH